MDKTLGLSLVIGAALGKGYFSTFTKAEQKVTRLGGALAKSRGLQSSIARFKKLKKGVGDTAKEMKAAQVKVATLAREIRDTDKPSKTLIRNFDQAKKKSAQLKRAHRSQSEQLHKLRGEMRGAGVDTRKLAQAEKVLGRSLDETRRKMERFNKAQTGRQAAAGKFTAMRGKMLGMIGAAYGAVKVAGRGMDLDMRLEQLGVQANKSSESMRELRREMAEAGNASDIKVNPDRITSAIEEIVEKTGDLDFARENIRNIGLAMRATGADGVAIGGIMAELQKMSTFKTPEAILTTLDILTSQGKEGAFTLANLAAQGPRVVTAYSSVVKGARDGATVMREMGAALQIIRMGTGSSEQAATAFERLLSELTNNEKLAKLRDLGINVFDQEALANGEEKLRPVTDLMREIMEATDGKKTLLGEIFGDEAIRAFNAFDVKLLDKFMSVTGDGSTITADAARLADRSKAQWESFAANITRVGDAFATTLLPAINAVLEPIGNLMTWVAEGLEAWPALGGIIAAVAGGFAIYAAGLGVVTAAQWLWNAAQLANPIGATIAAVTVLATGAFMLYKNWDSVLNWFSEKLDWLGDKFSWVGDTWSSIFGDDKPAQNKSAGKPMTPVKKTALAATAAAGIIASASPAAGVNMTDNSRYQISVTAQPGMDGKKMADEIMREIERKQAAKRRASLHDGGDQ